MNSFDSTFCQHQCQIPMPTPISSLHNRFNCTFVGQKQDLCDKNVLVAYMRPSELRVSCVGHSHYTILASHLFGREYICYTKFQFSHIYLHQSNRISQVRVQNSRSVPKPDTQTCSYQHIRQLQCSQARYSSMLLPTRTV